jgi:hypothetical protein
MKKEYLVSQAKSQGDTEEEEPKSISQDVHEIMSNEKMRELSPNY